MIKDVSEVTCLVVDKGIFFPVALRLAEDFQKVYYYMPDGEPFERVRNGWRGAGNPKVERIAERDLYKVKKEVDCFCYPDIGESSAQRELEDQDRPVWGSKAACDIENFRGMFLDILDDLGFDYPKTERIVGLSNLRSYLKERDGDILHIKISRWRGDMETWQHMNYAESVPQLDLLAIRMGPISEKITFYVQEHLETDLEAGSDPYCIDGQWPDNIIVGYEKKGESYLAAVQPRSEIAPEIWKVNEAFTPFLKKHHYRNFFSTEVRIKDRNTYFLDPCCRCPSPAGEEQLKMYSNFGEIVWRGAHGELVQPEYTAKFCGEAVVSWCGENDAWHVLKVPDEAKKWFTPYACAEVDGTWVWPPGDDHEVLGCIVGLGDTIQEVISHLQETAELMKDLPVDIKVEPIADLLKEVAEAEEEGIPFTEQKIPEPAVVLDNE